MRRSNFVPTKIFAHFSRLIEGYCRSKLKPGSDAELFMSRAQYIYCYRAYSNDVTAAILVFENNAWNGGHIAVSNKSCGIWTIFFVIFFCCNKIRSIQSVKILEWLNQLGTRISIWKDSVVQFAQPFQLEISTREASMERLWFRHRTFQLPNRMNKLL